MAGKEETESWEWHDEVFNLDEDSPLGLSCSLWDDLTQSEADSRSLFESTPATESRDIEALVSSLDSQGCGEDSLASFNTHQYSPRLKRRRMLFFASANPDDDIGYECFDTVKDLDGSLEDFGNADPLEATSFWLNRNDDFDNPLDEGVDSQSSECWMTRCLNDNEPQLADQSNPLEAIFPHELTERAHPKEMKLRKEPAVSVTNRVASFALAARKRDAGDLRSPTSKLVYPFALLKPCGVQGDVTLQDINRRIQMAPDASKQQHKHHHVHHSKHKQGKKKKQQQDQNLLHHHQQQQQQQQHQHHSQQDQALLNEEQQDEALVYHNHEQHEQQSGKVRPENHEQQQQRQDEQRLGEYEQQQQQQQQEDGRGGRLFGMMSREAGFSGKAVIALTKIHTEGNGSITILRTRG